MRAEAIVLSEGLVVLKSGIIHSRSDASTMFCSRRLVMSFMKRGIETVYLLQSP